MKIEFNSWFYREIEDTNKHMFVFNLLPIIGQVILETNPKWLSINFAWLFWDLNIEI